MRCWPPLIAATPTAQGANVTLPSVATDGRQVAYDHHFLYTFVEDSPGYVAGQGVQDFLVATPNLASTVSAPTTSAPTTTANSDGY